MPCEPRVRRGFGVAKVQQAQRILLKALRMLLLRRLVLGRRRGAKIQGSPCQLDVVCDKRECGIAQTLPVRNFMGHCWIQIRVVDVLGQKECGGGLFSADEGLGGLAEGGLQVHQ